MFHRIHAKITPSWLFKDICTRSSKITKSEVVYMHLFWFTSLFMLYHLKQIEESALKTFKLQVLVCHLIKGILLKIIQTLTALRALNEREWGRRP